MKNKKIIVIGDPDCGKSSIIEQICFGTFSESNSTTIGVSFRSVEVDHYKFQIWEIAGESYDDCHLPSYIKSVDGIVFVADQSRSETISNLAGWINSLTQSLGEEVYEALPKVYVINKTDLTADANSQNQIDFLKQAYDSQSSLLYYCSAKNTQESSAPFIKLDHLIYEKAPLLEQLQHSGPDDRQKSSIANCCSNFWASLRSCCCCGKSDYQPIP